MDKKKTAVTIIVFAVIVLGIVALMSMVAGGAKVSTKYDSLVQCLQQKGVKFYGAFWCPHCQKQEQMLNMSRQTLEDKGLYTECSTPDGSAQTPACIAEKIESYPTWVFPDGSRTTGELEPADLATKASCDLPK
jgi:hypothetical protein